MFTTIMIILMKYTSSLEESAKEYHNCNHCHSFLTCKNKIKGYAYLPKVNDKIITFKRNLDRIEQKNNSIQKHTMKKEQ